MINNGSNWTAINNGLLNTSVVPLAISGANIFAGTVHGGVFLSTDNGSNWTAVNNGFPTNTAVSSFAISGTNIFAATYNGIFLSKNNGSSWTEVNTGLTNSCVGSLMITGTNIFAGTCDGGVWKRPLSEMVGVDEPNSENANFKLYPNPTTGRVTIKSGSIDNIEVFNTLGDIIFATTNFKHQIPNGAGQVSNEIDLSQLPKGIYLVKIYDGVEIYSRKIVLQ